MREPVDVFNFELNNACTALFIWCFMRVDYWNSVEKYCGSCDFNMNSNFFYKSNQNLQKLIKAELFNKKKQFASKIKN